MKPWIKSLSPNDPALRPIMEAFSYDGYGRFIAVLEYCLDFDVMEIDAELIKKQTGCNSRGAAKFLTKFQETLRKVCPKFHQSLPKVSPKFEESLPKLEAQKPHGSTRDQEENRGEENRKNPPTPKGESLRFDEFWAAYPNKKAKAKARSIWERKKLDRLADQIIAGVNRYAASSDWQKENGRYIPHPTTFLEQERWEDQLQTVLPKQEAETKPLSAHFPGCSQVRNLVTGELYPIAEMEPVLGRRNEWLYRRGSYSLGILEGVKP